MRSLLLLALLAVASASRSTFATVPAPNANSIARSAAAVGRLRGGGLRELASGVPVLGRLIRKKPRTAPSSGVVLSVPPPQPLQLKHRLALMALEVVNMTYEPLIIYLIWSRWNRHRQAMSTEEL